MCASMWPFSVTVESYHSVGMQTLPSVSVGKNINIQRYYKTITVDRRIKLGNNGSTSRIDTIAAPIKNGTNLYPTLGVLHPSQGVCTPFKVHIILMGCRFTPLWVLLLYQRYTGANSNLYLLE